jgi:hypothetical protein
MRWRLPTGAVRHGTKRDCESILREKEMARWLDQRLPLITLGKGAGHKSRESSETPARPWRLEACGVLLLTLVGPISARDALTTT